MQEQLAGMVAVTVTGHKEVVDAEIKEEAVDPDDIEMLQDLVLKQSLMKR